MTINVKHIKESKINEPMVMFPLRQYDELMEYLEDMEDRLSVKERANDKNIPWSEVKKDIRKKLTAKPSKK